MSKNEEKEYVVVGYYTREVTLLVHAKNSTEAKRKAQKAKHQHKAWMDSDEPTDIEITKAYVFGEF